MRWHLPYTDEDPESVSGYLGGGVDVSESSGGYPLAPAAMSKLWSDDEDEGKDVSPEGILLTINEHYAKAFEYKKEREELERLKEKYGSDYDPDDSNSELSSSDSESAESEDEDGEELTPAVDAAILRTLARIKKKDPEIYDSSKNIFGEEREKLPSKAVASSNRQLKSKDQSKPITIRQANLDSILEGSRSPSPSNDSPEPLTHVQEQERLRRETIAAFHNAVSEDQDDFLIPREKTKDELEREEEEYRAFLEREVGDLKDLVSIDGDAEDEPESEVGQASNGVDEKPKKKKKKKSKMDLQNDDVTQKISKAEKDQEFLMNYILNRGWIDRSDRHVPTYQEITSSTLPREKRQQKGKGKARLVGKEDGLESGSNLDGDSAAEEDTGLLSDASFDSLASHFEASYNHRFEEPGADAIPSFPRQIQSTVRRADTSRKEARERKRLRKEEEMEKRQEEVRTLKALKMREVRRKLEIIGRHAGLKGSGKGKGKEEDFLRDTNGEVVDKALRELDLDGEWDPEKHDRQMAGLFDREAEAFEDDGAFEHEEEGLAFDGDGKPVWDDDVDIGDILLSGDDAVHTEQSKKDKKKEKKKKKKKVHEEDKEGVDIDAMDADAEPQFEDDEVWDGTEEMRKRVLDKYMEDIYALNFNDMVGDLATRFKYVPAEKTNYALSPVEILMATDKELNEYVSVKRYAPYRQDKSDKQYRFGKKNQDKLKELKGRIAERGGGRLEFGFGGGPKEAGVEGGDQKPKKRKGKKERMKMKASVGDGDDTEAGVHALPSDAVQPTTVDQDHKPKKRKREDELGKHIDPPAKDLLSPVGNVDDHGAPKKKRKRRHKKEVGAAES